jgi:hypothetical protein
MAIENSLHLLFDLILLVLTLFATDQIRLDRVYQQHYSSTAHIFPLLELNPFYLSENFS